MEKGLFITLEGPDGSGKSTQASLLHAWLLQSGRRAVLTREPGGTPISEKIRALILDPQNAAMDAKAEALLYAASRAQLVFQRIRPALQGGCIVVCDRYLDSSIAYQGYGRGLGGMVKTINEFATGSLLPDLTFFLDLEPEKALKRAAAAKGRADRIEEESLAFHRAVYEGYLTLCRENAGRFVRIDASGSADEVFMRIQSVCERRLAHA